MGRRMEIFLLSDLNYSFIHFQNLKEMLNNGKGNECDILTHYQFWKYSRFLTRLDCALSIVLKLCFLHSFKAELVALS